MRTPLIAANWKMHKTLPEAKAYLDEFLPKVKGITDKEIVIFPPAVLIPYVTERLKGSNASVGCQNIHHMQEGAYTGCTSIRMVKDICQWVMVGHSERRIYCGETDETVQKKVALCMEHNMRVILCVGENADERQEGKTNEVVSRQVTAALGKAIGKITIAYEPVWAIGTGANDDPSNVQEVHALLRKILKDRYGDQADSCRIIYGGSVKADNVKELMRQQDVDGGLVGTASLDASEFATIARF